MDHIKDRSRKKQDMNKTMKGKDQDMEKIKGISIET